MYISEHTAAAIMEDHQDVFAELEAETNALETEDDAPVDNIISERQQRLLTDALYASWKTDETFVALANVGLFVSPQLPPIVPDVLLSLGVEPHPDLKDYNNKKHQSYMMWYYGKPPDVVLEIVSNVKGHELREKLTRYAEIGVEYYVVYDPLEFYGTPTVRVFVRRSRKYEQIDEAVFPDVGLRLKIWNGMYQGIEGAWLRWFTMDGTMLLVGEELGTLLEEEKKRVKKAETRASTAETRASAAEARAEELAAKLRALGIDA
jgi:Uma2 family endonuclease